jgi:protein TonB
VSYRADRSLARAARRGRANARVKVPVDRSAVRDPFEPRADGDRGRKGVTGASVAASLGVHGAIMLVGHAAAARADTRPPRVDRPIDVQILEPVAPAPRVEAPQEVAVVVPPRRVERPRPSVSKTVPEPPAQPPALEVLDPPPEPAQPATPDPPRRVVGIELESTTVGGAGPGFATGNTRMGVTATVAQDPEADGAGGPSFTLPRRVVASTPEYPASLKARGIEGDVSLRVEIDPAGRVTDVAVVTSSGRPEFDRAATEAAARSVYVPAKLNGVGVAHAIEFAVRFRLHT